MCLAVFHYVLSGTVVKALAWFIAVSLLTFVVSLRRTMDIFCWKKKKNYVGSDCSFKCIHHHWLYKQHKNQRVWGWTNIWDKSLQNKYTPLKSMFYNLVSGMVKCFKTWTMWWLLWPTCAPLPTEMQRWKGFSSAQCSGKTLHYSRYV